MNLRRPLPTALAMLLAAFLAGCVFAPVVPPRGILFNDQTAPLFGGKTPGSKKGTASAHNILFLVGWGNSGLNRAMQDGGIERLHYTDYRVQNYLLVYQRYTTIAYGE